MITKRNIYLFSIKFIDVSSFQFRDLTDASRGVPSSVSANVLPAGTQLTPAVVATGSSEVNISSFRSYLFLTLFLLGCCLAVS